MMKRKTRLDYLSEAIRYLCLAVVFVLGIFSMLATGGGGGSSGSSSGNTLVSEASVLVLTQTATPAPIQGANVRAVFLYKASNVTEESNCVTAATGRCVVTVTMSGQLADEVSLTVSQPNFHTAIDKETLDSTGSVNANVYMAPLTP
jgi:hypothetical protein